MKTNYYQPINKYYNNNEGDRFFFAAPFLFGALAGGAVASSTRPRPVFVSSPPVYNQPYQQPHQVSPNTAYGNASYSYYYPVYK